MFLTLLITRVVFVIIALTVASVVVAGDAGQRYPRGFTVAFVANRYGEDDDIHLLDTSTQATLPLIRLPGQDWSPAWSPDGSRLAFTSNEDLYILDLNYRRLNRITDHGRVVWPAWSPDGSRLAFASNMSEGIYQVYVMDADGANLRAITGMVDSAMHPTWSPDGAEVLYHSGRGRSALYRVDVQSLDTTLVTGAVGTAGWAAWSPDGSLIATRAYRDGNREIFVMDADGTNERRLTYNWFDDGMPSWTPDGRHIIYYAEGSSGYDLYIMDPDGSQRRSLTALDGNEMFPAVRP